MKTIQLPPFNPSLSLANQAASHFAQCGLNAFWPSCRAFHLSEESITGHRPNTTSGDFYLVEVEQGVWQVVTIIYAKDRTDSKKASGTDLVDACFEAPPAEVSDLWEYLRDPVMQAHYLHASQEELNEAMGIVPAPRAKPQAAPSVLDQVLAMELSPHCYTLREPMKVKYDDGTENLVHDRYLGFGRLLSVVVRGSDIGRAAAGFPSLENNEAQIVSEELMRRWNNHSKLVNMLYQAIEESGFSVNGPSDSRAAENGEPKWVCVARGVISEAKGPSR